MDSLSPLEPYTVEIDKRDAENAILLTPPDSIAYLMELPRTDRKNLQKEIVEELRAMLTPEEWSINWAVRRFCLLALCW